MDVVRTLLKSKVWNLVPMITLQNRSAKTVLVSKIRAMVRRTNQYVSSSDEVITEVKKGSFRTTDEFSDCTEKRKGDIPYF